jgi:hypothetical protein
MGVDATELPAGLFTAVASPSWRANARFAARAVAAPRFPIEKSEGRFCKIRVRQY